MLRIWKLFKGTGIAYRQLGQGRKRVTADSQDRYLGMIAERNRQLTSVEIARKLESEQQQELGYPDLL